MADIFDQLEAAPTSQPAQGAGDIFDQITAPGPRHTIPGHLNRPTEEGRPLWQASALAEINSAPGLDAGGKRAVIDKWQTRAQGPIIPYEGAASHWKASGGTYPSYYNPRPNVEGTPAPVQAINAFEKGYVVDKSLPILRRFAPDTANQIEENYNLNYPSDPTSTINKLAGATGSLSASLGLAGGGAAGYSTPVFAGEGALAGYDRASQEGAGTGAALGQAVIGGAAGAARIPAMRGTINKLLPSLGEGILPKAAVLIPVNYAEQAGIGLAQRGAENALAGATYDPSREPTAGMGDVLVSSIPAAVGFGALATGHAQEAQHVNRITKATGAQDVQLTPRPAGRAGIAAEYIIRASGRKPVWFSSDSDINGFPEGKRVYINANRPTEALPSIAAHEVLGHVAKDDVIANELANLRRQYPDLQRAAQESYIEDLDAAGFHEKAETHRRNPRLAQEEGTAKLIEEAVRSNPQLTEELAARYPNFFARLKTASAELIDRVSGGNEAKARLIREQLGLVRDVQKNVPAAAPKLARGQVAGEEAMLDRLEPQLQEAAQAKQAKLEQQGEEQIQASRDRGLQRDQRIVDEENQLVEQRLAEQRRRHEQEQRFAQENAPLREAHQTDRELAAENADAEDRLMTVGAIPRAALAGEASPARTKGFTKTELEQRLVDYHRSAGHEFGAEDQSLLESAASGDAFSFRDKLPEEAKVALEGRPQLKRYVRVLKPGQSGYSNAGGNDAMAQMGEDKWLAYLERRAGNRSMKSAIDSARGSDDAQVRFLADLYENTPAARRGGEKNEEHRPQVIVDADQLHEYHRGEIHGIPFNVERGEDGQLYLRWAGKQYPTEALDQIPVDRHTLHKQAPAAGTGEEIPFSVREQEKDLFGRPVAPTLRKDTGAQIPLFHEPNAPAPIARSAQDQRIANKFKAGEKATPSMFEKAPEKKNVEQTPQAAPTAPTKSPPAKENKQLRPEKADQQKPPQNPEAPARAVAHEQTVPPDFNVDEPQPITAYRGEPPSGTTAGEGPHKFYSADRSEAAKYGEVKQESLAFKNPLRAANWIEAKQKLGLPSETTMPQLLDAARDAGHDGIIWKHHGKDEYVKLGEPLGQDEVKYSVRSKEEQKPKEPSRIAGVMEKASQIGRDLRDQLTIDPIPKLARAGGDVADKAVEHASARIALPHMIDDLLGKVFPEQYRDPEAMGRTIDVLAKDNVLGGYDQFMSRSAQASAMREKIAGRIKTLRERSVELKAQEQTSDVLKERRAITIDIKKARKGAATAARESSAASKAAAAVAGAHDLPALDEQVRKGMQDPAIAANIDRWKEHINPLMDQLYNELKRVDPDTEREGRGRHLGARLNLVTKKAAAQWGEALADPTKPMPAPSSSSYRNPAVKKDRFMQAAKFTGDYSNDARAVLSAVLGPRWNEATKLRFYDSLIKSGAAAEAVKGEPPATIQGQAAKALPVEMPETSKAGGTRMVKRTLFVRDDLIGEVRGVLGTDLPLEQKPLAKMLTGVQLAQVADLVTHAHNVATVLTNAQGAGSAWKDVLRKIPLLGSADAIGRIWKVAREVRSDTPAIREEIATMAKAGLIRPDFAPSGLQKITHAQGFLHAMDTAARVAMNRFFDNLTQRGLVEDTAANRRDYINQVGQYNRRLMGPWMRAARDSGVAPFIVAGRAFNRQGRRALTGDPGIKAASTKAAVQMRLTNLIGSGLLLTVPMMLNSITTGSPSGRSGTPLGAWDLGTDEENGKHKVVDLLHFTGLRRGLRASGAEEAIEGVRAGKDFNSIAGNALQDVGNAAIHPWIGPAPSFLAKALTGRQLDLRGRMEAQTIPGGGAKQYLENFRAALESQNPLIYSTLRPGLRAAGIDHEPADKSYGADVLGEFLRSPSGALGVKDVKPAKNAAEDLADNLAQLRFGGSSPTPESAEKQSLRRNLLEQLRKDKSAGESAIEKAIAAGDLSEQEAALLHKKAGMSGLSWTVRALTAADAAKVYDAADDDQKAAMRDQVLAKITNSTDLSHAEQDQLIQKLELAPPPDLKLRRELHTLTMKARTYRAAKEKIANPATRAKALIDLRNNRMSAQEEARLKKLNGINAAVHKLEKKVELGQLPKAAAAAQIRQLLRAA